MPIDLTNVKARVNNIKRGLFSTEGITLQVFNGTTLLEELESGWFLPQRPVSNLAIGAEYFELSIVDETDDLDLTETLQLATEVQVNSERFKIVQYFRPRGLTRGWLLRLEPIGFARY